MKKKLSKISFRAPFSFPDLKPYNEMDSQSIKKRIDQQIESIANGVGLSNISVFHESIVEESILKSLADADSTCRINRDLTIQYYQRRTSDKVEFMMQLAIIEEDLIFVKERYDYILNIYNGQYGVDKLKSELPEDN